MSLKAQCGWQKHRRLQKYPYVPNHTLFGVGEAICPRDETWIYVRVPVLDPRLPDLRLVHSGQFHIQRYRKKKGLVFRSLADRRLMLPGGTVYRHEDDIPENMRRRRIFTVEECRSKLQQVHPDKGGTSAECQRWAERLRVAKEGISFVP